MSPSSTPSDDIAIIGLSGVFAGSESKDALWKNILEKQDLVSEAPNSWASPWYDPDEKAQGIDTARIRNRKVGLIGNLATFDPIAFGIPPNSVEGDPAHFLALQLAGDALQDAGYAQRSFKRERTGVIIGHGSNPNRGDVTGLQYGLVIDQTMELLAKLLPDMDDGQRSELRQSLKNSLPSMHIERAPTLISNVISGRIANRLDLMGPNYLVDSACSSSFIALDLGIQDLRSGRCDMMLIGGVQASMPAQIYMLFQNLGALAHTDIRPFDARANGTLLGEGVGFAVIKRLQDAVRDDDRIYAVVKSVGIASDGKAMGLLAPRLEGEALAIRRAYEQSRIDPDTIGLIEAHGTGIPLGDRTEIEALSGFFGKGRRHLPDCAIGSVKSMIGHCIPAAGIASLIKVALALHQKTLPPTLCDEVNPKLGLDATRFYVNTEVRPWFHGDAHPRRAGINAFGFGGINTHAILEEYRDSNESTFSGIGRSFVTASITTGVTTEKNKSAETDRISLSQQPKHSENLELIRRLQWPSELIVLTAVTRATLLERIKTLMLRIRQTPDQSLSQLAVMLWDQESHAPVRLALVVTSIDDLLAKLDRLKKKLPAHGDVRLTSAKQGIYYSEAARMPERSVIMFPSEGSQYQGMLADLAGYFPIVRGWFDFIDAVFPRDPKPSACIFPPPTGLTSQEYDELQQRIHAGDLATESVSMASHALYELLSHFGLACEAMLGHSAGEHVALRISQRVITASLPKLQQEMRDLNTLYQQLETENTLPTGSLFSVGGTSTQHLDRLLDEFADQLFLVADNCANQQLLFSTMSARPQVIERLRSLGAIFAEMPFNRAYHTPLFQQGAVGLRNFYQGSLKPDTARVPIYSCSTSELYPEDDEATFDIAAEHWKKPVQFRRTIEELYHHGVRVFIEVGPNNALTAFVENILKGHEFIAMASNVQNRPGLEQLQHLLGRLYTEKLSLDLSPLYPNEMIEPLSQQESRTNDRERMILKGELPWMTIHPDDLAQWRQSSTGFSTVDSTTRIDNSEQLGAHQVRETESSDNILQLHFKLMNRFLEGQEQVMNMLNKDSQQGTIDNHKSDG